MMLQMALRQFWHYISVKVKVADETSMPLTSINSGTNYFSYSLDLVTCVVTWSVCDGRPSGEAGALVRQTVETQQRARAEMWFG